MEHKCLGVFVDVGRGGKVWNKKIYTDQPDYITLLACTRG